MANNQDIKLRRLEELLAEYQEALTKTKQPSEQVKINNAILLVQDAITQEKTFRTNRDTVLRKREEFERVKSDVERLISEVQTGPVAGNAAALSELASQYAKLTGSADLPKDKDGKTDYDAALAQIQHLDAKLQIELDAVYGNVDARMLNKDKRELEAIEKGIAEKTQRGKDYRALKNKLKDLEADSDFAKKLDDYKNALKELNGKKAAKDAAQTKVNDLQGKIRANEAKLERLKKELTELKAIDPKDLTKEQADRLKALPGEIASLEKYIGKLKTVELVAAEAELSNAQKEVEKAQTDFDDIAGKDEMKDIVSVMGLIEKLGITAGDKPLELTDDIESVQKAVNKAHRAEHLTAQKREMQERAVLILDKYGIEADPKKGKFVESLDARVEDIVKNYNPAHIQPGFDDRVRDEEHDEPGEEEAPAGPGESPAPGGTPGGAPGGTPGTRTSSVGGGFGAGPMFGSGGGSGAPGGTGTPPTPPAPGKDSPEEPTPEHENGNEFHNMLARGEIVERFDGDVDFQALLAEPGRAKIEKGFVYRIADIGPGGTDSDKREYAQVREPLTWYMEDTSKKLGRALTGLITQLRDMDETELEQLWTALGGDSSPDVQMLKQAVEKGPITRAKKHHDLMGKLGEIEPKAQVEMLIALTTLSEEDPKRAAECLTKMNGNPYPYKSDLIVTTEKAGFFGRKQVPRAVEVPAGAEDLLAGYRAKERGEGAKRGPTERQPRRDPKKAPKRDRRDQGEMDK